MCYDANLAAEVHSAIEHSGNGKLHNDNCKHEHDDGGVNIADALDAGQPSFAASTEGVHCTPHAVSEVEPDGQEPYKIKHGVNRISKSVLNPVVAISGQPFVANVCQFHEHHLCPEVIEVKGDAEENNDTDDKHVLRSPFHLFRTVYDCITAVTASIAVLCCQDESIDEVDEHQYTQSRGCCYGIPVGAEHFANHVVALSGEECYHIHASVEGEEENQGESCDRHEHLSSDR